MVCDSDGIIYYWRLSILRQWYKSEYIFGHCIPHSRDGVESNLMENKIKIFRNDKKITQQELANRCKVTRQTVNAIENNKYDPSLQLAFDLAKNLNTTVDQLFNPNK